MVENNNPYNGEEKTTEASKCMVQCDLRLLKLKVDDGI